MKPGFTFLEVVLVVGIMTILVASFMPLMSSFYLTNNLDVTQTILVSSIKKAQQYAISKRSGLTWGLCLSGNTLRLYGGSCASPTIKDDFTLPNNVFLSGLSDFTLQNLTGEPSSPQTINLSANGQNKTVIINSQGGVSVN